MIEEFSAGIVPIDLKQKKVFLVQHLHGEHWGFPKGHIEEGEDPLRAAKRELYEECALRVTERLCEKEYQESYQFDDGHDIVNKRVVYFVYRVHKTDFELDEQEIKDGGWFSIPDALGRLTFEEARTMLVKIAAQFEEELEL